MKFYARFCSGKGGFVFCTGLVKISLDRSSNIPACRRPKEKMVKVWLLQSIAPPRMDSSKGPHRVNRAHWPTKENKQKHIIHLFVFSGPWQKLPQMGPNGILEFFFLLIQTLPTFWAERIFILRTFTFLICWTPIFWISRSPDLKISVFPGPQVSKFPDLQIPRFPDAGAAAAAGRTLRPQPDPSPNAPRDQIRRKGPCCDYLYSICL